MSTRRLVQVSIGLAALLLLAWGATQLIEGIIVRPQPVAESAAAPTTPAETAHITATVFYGAEDGGAMVPVAREVPLEEGVAAQGREIIAAQLLPAPEPYLSLIPAGTRLREFYVTEQGDAYVDLSNEVSRAHPGGTSFELLTVYAIVNAVTTNLPAVQRVQILVDGNEVDTLAGHVDVRHPLTPDASLVREGFAPR